MSKGYIVYPLMKQPRENVIDEHLIRDCIHLKPASSSDEERLRVVGNREEALLQDKMKKEVQTIGLHQVDTLLISFRRIGKIENLYGLGNLTKLCLDNNHIRTIENISHLTKLQSLDLSFNQISVMEGMDTLVDLESLNLFSNQIMTVSGLEGMKKLTTLSLGNNKVENLDESARYLHQSRNLRVLTFKGCKVENLPHYRTRLLAFVSTLRYLDGKAVREAEVAQAREEQRENLMPLDEEDERQAVAEKAAAEEESKEKEYQLYNCPDDSKLCDELFQLQPENHNMVNIIRCDILITSTKEIIDRFQADFNEKAKELADAMKAIRARRDADDKSYKNALATYEKENSLKCLKLIKEFEALMKNYLPRGIGRKDPLILDQEQSSMLHMKLITLKSDLLEKEAEMFDVFETLHNATVAKWKADQADVLIQTSFETLGKAEADFQSVLRQAFDQVFEQRQKREHPTSDDYYYSSKTDESIIALLDNKDDYQKLLGEWFEMRRRKLEELELYHLKEEDTLLTERARHILQTEQDRHRNRVNEIDAYYNLAAEQIDSHS
eukprot:gene5493-3965_t